MEHDFLLDHAAGFAMNYLDEKIILSIYLLVKIVLE
jgi:hypothetical protein